MRRFGLYAALALCVCGLPTTAADQYEQSSLERLHSYVVTLTYTQNIPRDDNDVGTAELGFICIQKDGSRTFGVQPWSKHAPFSPAHSVGVLS